MYYNFFCSKNCWSWKSYFYQPQNLCGGQRRQLNQSSVVSWSNSLPTLIPLMPVLQGQFADDLTWKEMVRIQTFWPLRILQRSLRPDHQGRVMLKLDHVLNMSITTIIRYVLIRAVLHTEVVLFSQWGWNLKRNSAETFSDMNILIIPKNVCVISVAFMNHVDTFLQISCCRK